jgi:hypothetical protein
MIAIFELLVNDIQQFRTHAYNKPINLLHLPTETMRVDTLVENHPESQGN